jgi:hypothetical protein
MAIRHGDDQIASVLNRGGYSIGKGNLWNQNRVAVPRKVRTGAGSAEPQIGEPKKTMSYLAIPETPLARVSLRGFEEIGSEGALELTSYDASIFGVREIGNQHPATFGGLGQYLGWGCIACHFTCNDSGTGH